jgi:putative iron-only hydrogenase system regulator
MSTRVAVIAIVVENLASIEAINALLHDAHPFVIGRMGVPYRSRGINVISVAVDAPMEVISALAGKVGNLEGVSTKTAYSNVVTEA